MTSVRKSIKAAKRKLKELQAEDVPQEGSIRITASLFANAWQIASVPSVSVVRSTVKLKAYTRREERKIKKQGKWTEYRECVAYQKYLQSTLVFPLLIDTPTMSYKEYREVWFRRKKKTQITS